MEYADYKAVRVRFTYLRRNPMLQVDMEDVIDESELHDHLRSQENEESIEDINEELQTNLEDTDSDSKDL